MSLDLSLKDILLAIPAWTGAICAVWGLRAWQRQLHGREGYDLARRLLRAAYKLRDAIHGARSPFSFRAVLPAGADAQAKPLAAALWQERWEPIDSARRELMAELLEAEVVWGADYKDRCKKLFDCESELYGAVLEQLDAVGPDAEEALKTGESVRARRAKLYAKADRSDDLSKAIVAAVEPIERDLGPRLLRRGSQAGLRKIAHAKLIC